MEIVDRILNAPPRVVTYDIESNHADIHLPDWDLWGISFFMVLGGNPLNIYIPVTTADDHAQMRILFEGLICAKTLLVAHNAKFDLKGLRRVNILTEYPDNVGAVVDTMVGMNLVDENISEKDLGLKPLTKKHFGFQMASYKETMIATAGDKNSIQFAEYAKSDTLYTHRLWMEIIQPQIKKLGLEKLLFEVIMQKVIYMCEMEDRGLRWSFPRSRDLLLRYATLRASAEDEVHAVIGADISLNSPAALVTRIFDDMHYDTTGVSMTPSGDRYSLNKEALDVLAKRDPVFKRLRDFRSAEKMINTYIEPNVRRAMASHDGRVHPSFWPTSKTGRDRSSNPNFQNQPVISDPTLNIRDCVIPAEGFKLLVADLSQIELRGCAHVTGDVAMTKAYTTWQCRDCGGKGDSSRYLTRCPTCGAAENERILKDLSASGFWHGLDIHQMTADATGLPRSPGAGNNAAAKSVNFAAIYMATPWKMMEQFGTYDESEWAAILAKFFTQYPGVKQWHIAMKAEMTASGIIQDPFGRYRRVPKEDIRKSFKHALNMFVNFPIQAMAANYLAVAERKIRRELIDAGVWLEDVFPINVVHDEVCFECREELIEPISEVILWHMRYAVNLDVPVNAELSVVNSWGKAK